jgi:integrase
MTVVLAAIAAASLGAIVGFAVDRHRRRRQGLRRHRIDFLRRILPVEEQVTTGRGRPPALTSKLKTPASRRRVPLPDVVLAALARELEQRDDVDVLFLTPRSGALWRRQHFNDTVWKPTLRAAKLDESLGVHVLRHTYASHLIAAAHHPRVIQARLGHASIVETMDTYGHLFLDSGDETRTALGALLADERPGSEGAVDG